MEVGNVMNFEYLGGPQPSNHTYGTGAVTPLAMQRRQRRQEGENEEIRID